MHEDVGFRNNMVVKVATPVEIVDGCSFRLRTDQIIILEGCTSPAKNSENERKAMKKLEELVFKKKVSLESHSIDTFGRSRAQVNLEDGSDVNKIMKEFIEKL
jgi:endonuclease YncB( thermonuclease family)